MSQVGKGFLKASETGRKNEASPSERQTSVTEESKINLNQNDKKNWLLIPNPKHLVQTCENSLTAWAPMTSSGIKSIMSISDMTE